MANDTDNQQLIEDTWRMFMTKGSETKEFRRRHLLGVLPSNPRCRFCYAPFSGVGGTLMRLFYDKRPSRMNPQLCNACEIFAEQHQGGIEVEMTLLFADVRGSTTLAEGMSPAEFGTLINRFYNAVSKVLIKSDALIDKLIGDQAAGIYVPGFAGDEHSLRAVEAAQETLRVTGHGDPDGPWIPLGVGVHTGSRFSVRWGHRMAQPISRCWAMRPTPRPVSHPMRGKARSWSVTRPAPRPDWTPTRWTAGCWT